MNLDLDGFFPLIIVLALIGVVCLLVGIPVVLWLLWTNVEIVIK